MSNWHFGTLEIVSVTLPAPKENVYGVPEGIMFSFPCRCYMGEWEIVRMEAGDELKGDIEVTIKDLLEERRDALGM